MNTIFLSSRTPTIWKIFLILLLILILGRFAIVGKSKILFNTGSSDGDETQYLTLGLALREDGTLTDGARPPLYPLALASIAERDWDYFTRAKILTMGLGTLAVVVAFWVGKSLFSWEAALLAAFLLATNKEFHLRASTVYADTLFVSIFLGTWYFLIRSFETARFCILAGIFTGLSYLTKGSAPLLLGAWGVTALLHYRTQIWRQKQLLLVLVFFLLTISPLLVFNANEFGSLFYNFNSAHTPWMDSWDESQVADPADLPTMSTYLQTHTLADMAHRLQHGISKLNAFLPTVLIPSRALKPSWLEPLLLATIVGTIGILLIRKRDWLICYYRRHRLILIFSLVLYVIFYIFLGWYGYMQVESRFIIPLLGPLYLLLADATVSFLRQIGQLLSAAGTPTSFKAAYIVGLATIFIWSIVWLIRTTQSEIWSLSVDAFASDREANIESEAFVDWIVQDHPAEYGEARVVFGPNKSLPLWKFPHYFTINTIPIDIYTWDDLQSYIDNITPHYIIIDYDTVRRRRHVLSKFFTYHDKKFEFEQIPDNWMLAYLYDEAPHTWGVFTPVTPPSVPVFANFGEKIELWGYDLIPPSESNRTLHLIIYWRAMAQPTEDYTGFIHLTAPDGFVKVQQDHQPFSGFWPTSRWRTGNIFADRYDISLTEGMQPGEYLLIAGLYSLQSGQRLPLESGPVSPSPDATLLTTITID